MAADGLTENRDAAKEINALSEIIIISCCLKQIVLKKGAIST